MPDPTGVQSHLNRQHRGIAWKEPCRVATTANITISTALNAGDTIDGVTLADGDRVLVKSQSTGSQNGIYVAGTTPTRAYDMDQDGTTSVVAEEIAGAFVWVIAGTANAQTLWFTTNVAGGTLGSTTITFSQFTGGGSTDLDAIIAASAGQDIADALAGAASPTAGNVFATMADVGSPSGSGHPLDTYTIDGTYGDDFSAGSLNGRWTRRNYTGGAETFQFTKNGTGLRLSPAGRAVGDGYFQTAPGGDWTFAMKYQMQQFGTNTSNWGIAVVNTVGTGLVTQWYTAPEAMLGLQLTTYSTYGGNYIQPGSASGSPNLNYFTTADLSYASRPVWVYLRKSGTNYYVNLSMDGEAWWVEGGPFSSAITVDRIGMIHGPLANVTGSTGATNDVFWFNKTA